MGSGECPIKVRSNVLMTEAKVKRILNRTHRWSFPRDCFWGAGIPGCRYGRSAGIRAGPRQAAGGSRLLERGRVKPTQAAGDSSRDADKLPSTAAPPSSMETRRSGRPPSDTLHDAPQHPTAVKSAWLPGPLATGARGLCLPPPNPLYSLQACFHFGGLSLQNDVLKKLNTTISSDLRR